MRISNEFYKKLKEMEDALEEHNEDDEKALDIYSRCAGNFDAAYSIGVEDGERGLLLGVLREIRAENPEGC